MNLIIDTGNTRIKFALFKTKVREIADVQIFGADETASIQHFLQNLPPIQQVVLSQVAQLPIVVQQFLQSQHPNHLVFSTLTPLPIQNNYLTPKTLGADRLAPMVAAHVLYPKQPVLVIDAGTCIKYNFLTANAEFLGGSISPGLTMRFKALHDYTHQLPLLQPETDYQQTIGQDTQTSLLSGVQTGAAAEMQNFINLYQEQYPTLMVILTGGDAPFFANRLKKQIFVDPFLVLRGLNEILEFVNGQQ